MILKNSGIASTVKPIVMILTIDHILGIIGQLDDKSHQWRKDYMQEVLKEVKGRRT